MGVADSVDFVGYVENPYAYIARGDVCVTATYREGLPNSVIEALVCGTPIVSTDCDSGPRELLAPDTDPFKRITTSIEWAKYGVLVPVAGISEMAEALEKLLRDPSLREKYHQGAIARSAIFDEETIIQEYLSVLTPAEPIG